MNKKFIFQLETEINNRNIKSLKDLDEDDNREVINKILDKLFQSKKICEEEFSRLPQKDILLAIIDNYIYDEKNEIKIINYDFNLKNVSSEEIDLSGVYFKEISKYPLLSKEDEKELGYIIKNGIKEEQEKAKKRLIECNLRLVANVAKSYIQTATPAVQFLDIIQEGNFGLMKAVEKYDPSLDYKFSTYAVWWIRQAIQRGNEKSSVIRIPANQIEKLKKVSRVSKYLANVLGRKPTDEEIIVEYNKKYIKNENQPILTIDSLHKLYLETQAVGSLDITIGEDGDDYLIDFIEDDNTNVENHVLNEISNDEMIDLMNDVLREREKDVILRRFGFNGRKIETLEEIANDYQCTKERIRQIEFKALKKLRIRLSLKEKQSEMILKKSIQENKTK